MTQSQDVVFEEIPVGTKGLRIGVARLNRPRQVNALTLAMCQQMLDKFRAWVSDEGVVAVMMEGEGDKGFCAGGDVAGVIRNVREGGPSRFVYGDAFFDVEYTLDLLLHTYPKPFLSWAHGICMGGGVGLTVGARHRIVSDGSKIAMPEIHIGLFPDVGGGWFLNRLTPGVGLVMALTGMMINEADALHAGLADYFVPAEGRAAFMEGLKKLDWNGDPRADDVRLGNYCLQQHHKYRAGLPVSNLAQYAEPIRWIGAQPDVKAVRDALLAVAEEDQYFRVPADNLANGSATAAHVTFEYLRRARHLSIAQVLRMDLTLARRFQRLNDFPEGVRALLIDKDRKPKWSPANLDAVKPELVELHFTPLPSA